MRRILVVFLFLFLGMSFLISSNLFADEPIQTEAAAPSTATGIQKVIDGALQPGTYEFVEKLVDLVGKGIDWYFDLLVKGADTSTIPTISNDIVEGIGQGLDDIRFTWATNSLLDGFEELTRKVWFKQFSDEVLQGTDVKVRPYFKGQFEYDSNVFLEPEAPKTRDEAVWTWTPGVSINYPFGDKKQYRVGAVYEARITDFTKYGEHSDIGQSFGAIANLRPTDEVYINVTEEFVQDAARAGTRSAKKVEYFDNKVTPTIGYHWRDWTFEGEYFNTIRDFDSSTYRAFSFANNGFVTRIYRTLAPNFRGLIDYTFSHYDYAADETRGGLFNQIRAGVTGKLSERTNILARVGYQDRHYWNHDTDFDIPVADVRLTHRLTSRTNLDFYFHRATQESSFTNNRAFDEKLVQGSGTYLFNPKLRGRAGSAFIRREFENEAATGRVLVQRRDIIGRAFVGFDYIFRPWLIVNVDYRYDRSNSNNSNFDYTNHQLTTGMTMPL